MKSFIFDPNEKFSGQKKISKYFPRNEKFFAKKLKLREQKLFQLEENALINI